MEEIRKYLGESERKLEKNIGNSGEIEGKKKEMEEIWEKVT